MTGEEVDPREPLLKKLFYLDMDKVPGSIGLMDSKQGDLAAFQELADQLYTDVLRAG
jgi:hypothetical protein